MEEIKTRTYVRMYAPDWYVAWSDLWDNIPYGVDKYKLSRWLFEEWLMTGLWISLFKLNDWGIDNGAKFVHSPHKEKNNE